MGGKVELTLISTVMISGTFAKYTSEYSGQDTALVAKWDLDVVDGEGEGEGEGNSFTISPESAAQLDLFLHKYDENIINGAGTQKIIAPGVGGSFVLSVTNNSDVAAEVEFDFIVTGNASGVPMEYSLGNFLDAETPIFKATTEDGSIVIPSLSEALVSDYENLAAGSGAKTIEVFWRWPFEVGVDDAEKATNNSADTNLGEASAVAEEVDGTRTKYILTVTATATQLTPGITPEP